MNKDVIQEYFKKTGNATISQVQLEFSMQYGETRAIFTQLEKEGVIGLQDDLNYSYRLAQNLVHKDTSEEQRAGKGAGSALPANFNRLKIRLEEGDELYRKVVEYCVKQTTVSKFDIQNHFGIGGVLAKALIRWLIMMKVIEEVSSLTNVNPDDEGSPRKVILTENDYEVIRQGQADYSVDCYEGNEEDRIVRDNYYMALWEYIKEEADKAEEDDDDEGNGGD